MRTNCEDRHVGHLIGVLRRHRFGRHVTGVVGVAGALALVVPGSALADTTIGFEDLSPGTSVTNQYASAGVVFGQLPGGASASQPTVVINVPSQAHSGSQLADIGCFQYQPCPNENIGTYIPEATGTFSVPRSHVSVYVGFLGSTPAPTCELGSGDAECAVVQLLAFDSNGQQIAASGPATVTQGAGLQTQLSVSTASPQIVGFEVTARDPTDSQKDVAIDDLSFDTPSQPPPPDFTLSTQNMSVTLPHGQSTTDQISINRIGSSSGQIQFSIGSLPTGVHARFAPNPADTQTTLTLSADRTVQPSASTITVTGTPLSASAGSSPRTLRLRVRVESACSDVLNGQDLVDALGSGCKRIYVDDKAHDPGRRGIDLAYMSRHADSYAGYSALKTYGDPADAVLHIPDGVTLESDRSARHAGALLYMSQNVGSPSAMLALQPGDRVTGLRLHGYSFGRGGDEDYTIGDKYGTTDGLEVSQPDVLIDNNDIGGWPGAGVNVHDVPYANWPPPGGAVNEPNPPRHSPEDALITSLAQRVHITNNFIHNNVGCSDGYGVVVGGDGAFALIDRNVFDYDKHDVAGDGSAGTGYIASSNLILTDAVQCRGDSGKGSVTYGGHFDMHGTAGGAGSGHVGGTGGTYIEIRDNAIRGDQRFHIHLGHAFDHRAAFDIRGTPTDKAIFVGNVTEASDGDAVTVSGPDQDELESHGKLIISGNHYGVNTSGDLTVGDFDGDGCSDAFLPTGAVWEYSPCGRGAWRYLNTSRYRLGQLLFGDFNGDGKTDVFTQKGDNWYVSSGARTAFEQLPAGSNIPMQGYRIGDFNGDGKADVFRANGSHWYYSNGGSTSWIGLASSSYKVDHLRFCDFNGDGKTDVFSLANDQWSVSYGGASGWQRLNSKLSSDLNELQFGDFNGDGRCDVARAYHDSWQISYGGRTAWHYDSPNRHPGDFSSTLIGHFAGQKCDDVLRFGGSDSHLDRFQISRCLTPFAGWSEQSML
jgi:hypothetical protein